MGAFIRRLLSQLLDVKSLVTLMLTGVFGHVTATGQVDVQSFLTIFSVVIAFYFGTQTRSISSDKSESQKIRPISKRRRAAFYSCA